MIEQIKQFISEQIEKDNEYFAVFSEGDGGDKVFQKFFEYQHQGSREAYRQILKFIEGLEK